MITIKKLSRDFTPSGFDYVFDKVKDFDRQQPWLYPKIDGSDWNIALIDFKIQTVRDIVKEDDDHVNLEILVKADVLSSLKAEYPDLCGNITPYQDYMKAIGNLSKLITPKASKELYSRCRGNITLARQILKKLDEDNTVEEIELSHINMMIMANDTIYARDVMLSLLLKGNKMVPRKGSYLSRFLHGYSNPYELYEKLSNEIGDKVAFYACRKYLLKLLETKIKYLNGEEVKEVKLIRVLDFYKLVYAYTVFMKSIPEQYLACLHLIERRNDCADIFSGTILTHSNKHDYN